MKERRAVSNAEFQAALANPDNFTLMKCETGKYNSYGSEDDTWTCGLQALWRALQYHDPKHPSGQKFTTTLYKFLHWELRRWARKARKTDCLLLGELPDNARIPGRREQLSEEATDALHSLHHNMKRYLAIPHQLVIRQHFDEGRTVEEIAKENGWTINVARNRLDRAISRLREVCTSVEQTDS